MKWQLTLAGVAGTFACIGLAVADIPTASTCPDGYTLIEGTAGNDILNGTNGNDCILGYGGHDVIRGRGGDDLLVGGQGNDNINGGHGNDRIWGQRGDDYLAGSYGDDYVRGGRGNDMLNGGNGDDTLRAGSGSDTVRGGNGADYIRGGRGDDALFGGNGDDRIRGATGADHISGGFGADFIKGGRGNDSIIGGTGNDTINGNRGSDTIQGGPGNDVIHGGKNADVIVGGHGNDSLHGDLGDDVISGGVGIDRLEGGDGNDRLSGGRGADILMGGTGDDIAAGNLGDDLLDGGPGSDALAGNMGTDVCLNGEEIDASCEDTGAGQCEGAGIEHRFAVTKAAPAWHGLWLPGFYGGGTVIMNFQYDAYFDLYDDGTAVLHGTAVVTKGPNAHMGEEWSVEATFVYRGVGPDGQGWGGPKIEKGQGKNLTDTWQYFDMVSGTLTRVGGTDYATLTQHPADSMYPFQMGVGANGKNFNHGASTWFQYTHNCGSGGVYSAKGDINVDLSCTDYEPEVDPEICDGVDNNCDGNVDENFGVGQTCDPCEGAGLDLVAVTNDTLGNPAIVAGDGWVLTGSTWADMFEHNFTGSQEYIEHFRNTVLAVAQTASAHTPAVLGFYGAYDGGDWSAMHTVMNNFAAEGYVTSYSGMDVSSGTPLDITAADLAGIDVVILDAAPDAPSASFFTLTPGAFAALEAFKAAGGGIVGSAYTMVHWTNYYGWQRQVANAELGQLFGGIVPDIDNFASSATMTADGETIATLNSAKPGLSTDKNPFFHFYWALDVPSDACWNQPGTKVCTADGGATCVASGADTPGAVCADSAGGQCGSIVAQNGCLSALAKDLCASTCGACTH